jgi:hypothetical protein
MNTTGPRWRTVGHVTDLGDEHGGEHRADPAQSLHRLMALQPAIDAYIALVDLAVIELDQVAQRLDPVDVLVTETQTIEPLLSAGLPDRVELGDHSLLAQRLMHLRLEPGAQPGQLGALCRGSDYAEEPLAGLFVGGDRDDNLGIIGGWSEAGKEGEKRVAGPVATGGDAGWRGASEGAFFDGDVGVDVDHRGVDAFVAEP